MNSERCLEEWSSLLGANILLCTEIKCIAAKYIYVLWIVYASASQPPWSGTLSKRGPFWQWRIYKFAKGLGPWLKCIYILARWGSHGPISQYLTCEQRKITWLRGGGMAQCPFPYIHHCLPSLKLKNTGLFITSRRSRFHWSLCSVSEWSQGIPSRALLVNGAILCGTGIF